MNKEVNLETLKAELKRLLSIIEKETKEREEERLEKVRKTLIKALKYEINAHCEQYRYFGIQLKDFVACLEKQKEQTLKTIYIYPKFRVGDEIVEICPNGSYPPVVVKYIGDGGYSCESKDKKRHLSFPIKQEDEYKLVEQKPVKDRYEEGYMKGKEDALEGVKKNWRDYFKPQDVTDIYNEGRNLGFKEGVASVKLVGWSEEDKRKLNRIYSILGMAADTHAFSTTCRLIGDKEAVELQDFLRSIAKPQDTEWSEEDERIRKAIITLLQEVAEDDDYCGTKHCKEYIAWLEGRAADNRVEQGRKKEALKEETQVLENLKKFSDEELKRQRRKIVKNINTKFN